MEVAEKKLYLNSIKYNLFTFLRYAGSGRFQCKLFSRFVIQIFNIYAGSHGEENNGKITEKQILNGHHY